MDFRVLGDLVARERRSDAPALRVPALDRKYDYRRFCTNAWKTGNFLRHLGVRSGDAVAVAADPAPEPVLALFGSALLGAVTRFVPLGSADVERARAAVLPLEGADGVALSEQTERIVYGGDPEDPSAAYFERDVWSENPTEPPDEVAPDDPGLRTHSHARLLDAADGVGDRWGLDDGCAVALRAPLTHPGTVIAALAALAVEGCVVLGDGSDADYAVATDDVPGTRVLSPDDVV
jgi:hypothetical protein